MLTTEVEVNFMLSMEHQNSIVHSSYDRTSSITKTFDRTLNAFTTDQCIHTAST
jgi:hypothetical protein